MAAHDEWLAERRAAREAVRAAAARGRCTASTHGTLYAYEVNGCRCAGAVVRKNRHRGKWGSEGARRRWGWWRGRSARVSRTNLWMLVRGFRDSPTSGEEMAAVVILSERRVGTGPRTSRPMSYPEIAERIGCHPRRVERLIAERKRRARLRHERRALDAAWKAHRVRRAEGRKERVAAEHAAARARKAERYAAWKQHCRTVRRLRESQERAKTVALAIEKRARRG